MVVEIVIVVTKIGGIVLVITCIGLVMIKTQVTYFELLVYLISPTLGHFRVAIIDTTKSIIAIIIIIDVVVVSNIIVALFISSCMWIYFNIASTIAVLVAFRLRGKLILWRTTLLEFFTNKFSFMRCVFQIYW